MTEMMNKLLLLFICAQRTAAETDYWSENFDEGKNCASEDLIKNITQIGQNTLRCVTNSLQDSNQAIDLCKKELANKVISICQKTSLKQAGQLLYCNNRGVTTCCFDQHQCVQSWDAINKEFDQIALNYLKDKNKTLEEFKTQYSMKTCHAIEGYDATICHEDCKSFENSTIADKCKEKKGLLKCCIRRDKFNCDECRYCCTFPFCTYNDPDKGITYFGEEIFLTNVAEDQQNNMKATDFLMSPAKFYKDKDTRCLKPNSDPDPTKWEHYVPEDFVNATSQEELAKAGSVKFDKRFFNWEDPEVLEIMTGKDKEKVWKEVFGFDFVASENPNAFTNISSMVTCAKDCIKAEQSKFARKCKKNNGFFKCCINTLSLVKIEDTRKLLKKEGLISSASNFCGDDGNRKNCKICTSTYTCTTLDPFTNTPKTEYKTPEVNILGGMLATDPSTGGLKRLPYRSVFCVKPDFCSVKEVMYDVLPFDKASSKQEYCELKTEAIETRFIELAGYNETLEDCLARDSVIRICPDNLLKEIGDDYITKINHELKSAMKRKKGKKKKKKKKKKRKRKRRKKSEKKAKKAKKKSKGKDV